MGHLTVSGWEKLMDGKPKIPDSRAMEKMTSDLSRLMRGKKFETPEEMNAYMNGLIKTGKMPKPRSKKAADLAQDIMYSAWDEENPAMRVMLAKEALEVSPDCADAYNLVAEEISGSIEEACELYRQGMEAGERALGKKFSEEERGYFWGVVESRPYMRARLGFMECLWTLGKHEEAIQHAREMLELNQYDNQGIRYILAAYLAESEQWAELDKLINKGSFKDDIMAEWLYTRALLSFVKTGASPKAGKELKAALERNAFAPEYLAGKKSIPRNLPNRITSGGEDEGYCYADRYLKIWESVPGAIDWLKEKTGIKVFPKTGRNEPCPCGSGKKYKKCCGSN
jgi:tetratricopeptide (TPR) repeat protein